MSLTLIFPLVKLNDFLIEEKDRFHLEKEHILAVGLQVSSYINVDDTGARHKGKNGYCTHIGNEYFSWFESTESKSRINFLKLMRAGDIRILSSIWMPFAICSPISCPKSRLKPSSQTKG